MIVFIRFYFSRCFRIFETSFYFIYSILFFLEMFSILLAGQRFWLTSRFPPSFYPLFLSNNHRIFVVTLAQHHRDSNRLDLVCWRENNTNNGAFAQFMWNKTISEQSGILVNSILDWLNSLRFSCYKSPTFTC